MSSAIWDWVAILTGLQSAGGTFVPLYWAIPARVSLFLGWTPPTPETVFAVWVALSLIAVAIFIWTRSQIGLVLACLVWGALFADTPYILVLPFAVWLACAVFVRARHVVRSLLFRLFPHRFGREEPVRLFRTPWGRCFFFAILGCLLSAAANLVRFELDYPHGYLRRAIAAIRWDGFSWSSNARRMDALLEDYVAELAREGADRKWIFTDGLSDSGIELAAHGRLRAVSLAGGGIDAATARQKGFARGEDIFALSTGAAQLLRAWAVDRPAELTNAVFQCGLGFLEQVAPDRVEPCGLVMRAKQPVVRVPHAHSEGGRAREGASTTDEGGRAREGASTTDAGGRAREGASTTDEGGRAREGADAVRALGERIVAFRAADGRDFGAGRLRSVRFGAMQWRVARAIRREAQVLDAAGRTDDAQRAIALSERLDELNPFAHAASGGTDPADSRAFNSLSPREGLAFALKRADFTLARRYAKPILEDDPTNAAANFALAMGHFKMREYTLAKVRFEKALAARPDDPSILNNLALTLLELGETDAARAKATAAQKLKPDSLAIRDTLRQIGTR